jgi:hypothetical protein
LRHGWLVAPTALRPLVCAPAACEPHHAPLRPGRDVIHAASNSLAADTENLLQSLLQACRQAPPQQQQAAGELAGAVTRYQCLLQLLRGRWPEALLPPCSAGYVAARLTTLAQGNCLEEYQWNAGGAPAGGSCAARLGAAQAMASCCPERRADAAARGRALAAAAAAGAAQAGPRTLLTARSPARAQAATGAGAPGRRTCPTTARCCSTCLPPSWRRPAGTSPRTRPSPARTAPPRCAALGWDAQGHRTGTAPARQPHNHSRPPLSPPTLWPRVPPALQVAKGMPLYLGRLPQRPPNQYSTILAFRPEQLSKDADAILATSLATAAPLFSFVMDGRLVTLVGQEALFFAMLLVLQLHKLRFNGLLGPASLSDACLRLADVIAPAPPAGSVPQRVFGWWFNG